MTQDQDQIWLELKEDKDTVYGKTMLEAFLMAVEELSSRHLLEALAMGHGNVMDQKMITKVLRNSSGTWSYEALRDKVIEGVENMSSRLVYNILKNEGDKTIDAIALKMGKRIQKIDDDDLFSLAYVGISSIGKVANLFGERLKKFSPSGMMKLLKEKSGINRTLPAADKQMRLRIDNLDEDETVESLGGWAHVLGRILEGRYPECGMNRWAELALTLHLYGTMDHFVNKLLEMKKTHPQVEVLAKYLRAAGSQSTTHDLNKQVLNILGGY